MTEKRQLAPDTTAQSTDLATDNGNPDEELREHPERELPGDSSSTAGKVLRPPRNDPRHTDQSVPPGQKDVPAGSERPQQRGSS